MSNTIKVVNTKNDKFDVYIGRKSSTVPGEFGNPFAINAKNNRDQVIAQFEEYFLRKPELMMSALKNLSGKTLGCFCAPLACHGDIYKKYVENPGLYNEERIKRGIEILAQLPEKANVDAVLSTVKTVPKKEKIEAADEVIEIKKPKPRSFKFKF